MISNNDIFKIAEKAGFILWDDESWNPGDIIDWSSRYDDELVQFAKLIEKYTLEGLKND